jgi:hypothetical protein
MFLHLKLIKMNITKWRDIIIALIIGVVIGVILISFGFKLVADNIKNSMILGGVLIIVVCILFVVIYVERKPIFYKILGLNKEDIEKIETSKFDLISAIKNNDKNLLEETIISTSQYLYSKYSEVSLRNWIFRILLSLLATIGGIITAGLLLKQNELIDNQNQLTSTQNRYLIGIDKPRLGIKHSGLTYRDSSGFLKYECAVKIENFGKRDAKEITLNSNLYEDLNGKIKSIQKEVLKPVNPITSGQELLYPIGSKSNSRQAKYYLNIRVIYTDELSLKKDTLNHYYRYPSITQLDNSATKESGLFNIESYELEAILRSQ